MKTQVETIVTTAAQMSDGSPPPPTVSKSEIQNTKSNAGASGSAKVLAMQSDTVSPTKAQQDAAAVIPGGRFGRFVLAGTRGGKPVRNWPGIIPAGAVIYGAMLAGLYVVFGRDIPLPKLIAGTAGAAGVVTGALVGLAMKMPVEQLTPLDRPLPPNTSTRRPDFWQSENWLGFMLLACVTLSAVITFSLPDKYRATATLTIAKSANPGLTIPLPDEAMMSDAFLTKLATPSRPLARLRENLHVRPRALNRFVDVSFDGLNPQEAVEVANQAVTAYIAEVGPEAASFQKRAVRPGTANAIRPNHALHLSIGLLLGLAFWSIGGWKTLELIRRSPEPRSRLELGKALLGGLAFPLMLLWALMCWFGKWVFTDVVRDALNYKVGELSAVEQVFVRHSDGISVVVSLAAWLLVCFLIVRRVWRAVNPAQTGSAAPPPAGEHEAEWRNPANWTGPVYFSKRDPRVWVPKKNPAFGWTVNFGRAWGLMLGVGILAAALVFSSLGTGYFAVRAHEGWEPQPMRWTEPPVIGSYASIQVSDIVRNGNIVNFSFVSDAGFPAHLLTVRCNGPGLDDLPPPYAGSELTGLLAPVLSASDPKTRMVLNGGNASRGPGEFRFGFVFPNADIAAMAAQQAQEIYLGQTLRPGAGTNSFMLFDLRRPVGKDTAGKETWQELKGELSVSPIAVEQVTKLVLPMDKEGLAPLFDLDRNVIVPDPTPNSAAAVIALLTNTGVVIRHDTQRHTFELLGMNGTVVAATRPAFGDQWKKLTDTEAWTTLLNNVTSPGVMLGTDLPDVPPQTFFFKTAAGAIGLLRVEEINDTAHTMKIRIKRVPPSPASHVAAPTGSVAEIIKLRLAARRRNLDEQTARSQAGLTTTVDVETARTDVLVLEAELAGDAVGAAKARLALAQGNLSDKMARYQAGLTTTAEIEVAKTDAAILEIKLREAEAQAAPSVATPSPKP